MSAYVNRSHVRSLARGDLVVPRSKLTTCTEKFSGLWCDRVEHTAADRACSIADNNASSVHSILKDCSCEHKHPCLGLLTKIAHHLSHMVDHHLHYQHLHLLLLLLLSFILNSSQDHLALRQILSSIHLFPFLPD